MCKRRDRATRNPGHGAGVAATSPFLGTSKQPRTPSCFAWTSRRVRSVAGRWSTAQSTGRRRHTSEVCRSMFTQALTHVTSSRQGTFQTRREALPAGPAAQQPSRRLALASVPSTWLCPACHARRSCEWAGGGSVAPGCPCPCGGHRRGARPLRRARLRGGAARPGLRDASLSRVSRRTPAHTRAHAAPTRPGGGRAGPLLPCGRGHTSAARRLPTATRLPGPPGCFHAGFLPA